MPSLKPAELLEMPVMGAAVVLAARHVVRRFALPGDLLLRLQVGFIALMPAILTMHRGSTATRGQAK